MCGLKFYLNFGSFQTHDPIYHNIQDNISYFGLPRWLSGKEPACQCRRHTRCQFNPWVRKIPWRRAWQPTLVSLTGEFHRQRSLAGYSPQGHKRVGHYLATKQQQPLLALLLSICHLSYNTCSIIFTFSY